MQTKAECLILDALVRPVSETGLTAQTGLTGIETGLIAQTGLTGPETGLTGDAAANSDSAKKS